MALRPLASTLLAAAAATSTTPGQSATTYFPPELEKAEGATRTVLPFGFDKPARMQTIYHAKVPGGARVAYINELSIRADGNPGNGWAAKPFVNVNVYVTHCPFAYDRVSAKFEDNRGSRVSTAFEGKLDLPAQGPHAGPGPRPFDITIKPTSPIPHYNEDDGYLLIEWVIINQPKGAYWLDSPFVCKSLAGPFGKMGPLCKFSGPGGGQPKLTNSDDVKLGGVVTWTMTNAKPQAPVLFVIGSRESGPSILNRAGTLPDHLADAGARDCYINTDWVLLHVALTNTLGEARYSSPVPGAKQLRRATFLCQTLTLDLAANAMGVIWSEGRKAQVCGPFECARVLHIGDLGVKTGTVQVGGAPVLRLRYQ